ncbi:MAG: zinc ribbon domain-containing protein [Elusimicrobiota bacterium]|jgi:hypothetical protein|nr:zinc ribbon domain-containing protein [Elusimicrobiota bacterium]
MSHSPAINKATTKYKLTNKLFCGNCGLKMTGESGTSKTGKKYYYYICNGKRKRLNNCQKNREDKVFLENYIVEQTISFVLAEDNIDYVAEQVYKEYLKRIESGEMDTLTKEISKKYREINNLIEKMRTIDSISAVKKFDEMVKNLDIQKNDLETRLAKLKLSTDLNLSKDEIKFFLMDMCKGDINNEKYKSKIIDTFINCIYVYDDSIVVYYNVSDNYHYDDTTNINEKANLHSNSNLKKEFVFDNRKGG